MGRDFYYDYHETRETGGLPDLILGYNQNPTHETFWRGVPECMWSGGEYEDWRFEISDHLPYIVKVNYK